MAATLRPAGPAGGDAGERPGMGRWGSVGVDRVFPGRLESSGRGRCPGPSRAHRPLRCRIQRRRRPLWLQVADLAGTVVLTAGSGKGAAADAGQLVSHLGSSVVLAAAVFL